MKQVIHAYIILAVIGGAAFVLSLFDIGVCVVYAIAGVPCPACGLTRAFMSLARLDIAGAFWYHPLFFIVPFIPLLFWEKITAKQQTVAAVGVVAAFIIVWVVRMVMFFPHYEPMAFNADALLWRLIYLR